MMPNRDTPIAEVLTEFGLKRNQPIIKNGKTTIYAECPAYKVPDVVKWLCVAEAKPFGKVAEWNRSVAIFGTGRKKTKIVFKVYCATEEHAVAVADDVSGIVMEFDPQGAHSNLLIADEKLQALIDRQVRA